MKNLVFLLLVLLGTTTALSAQGFYDLSTIQTIQITFAQSNWDQILDAEYAGAGGYIMAQSVVINGVEFDSVGVKYKGNSTYSANQVKNPFHIELDAYKNQDYQGYTDIKLSNVSKDPSFVREVLSYQILRQYMDAPQSNYANVYVNGVLIGLYSNSESVSKKFVNSHFYSKSNAFFKCNPPDGAGPGTSARPDLVYLGQDSIEYYDAYELKSDAGWQDLIDLCDTLANAPAAIERILDTDRVLWMLAFDNMLVNLDSYIGGFAQNYYLYRDDYNRFLPVVWDLNESFGRFSQTGSGNLNSTVAKQQMSHLLHASDANFPLVQKLLSVPRYKRMYVAHCKTMLLENFSNGSYYTSGQALQASIDAAVQADVNKFFTYANFVSNLTSDINSGGGPGGGTTPGITNLMNGRSTYLLGLSDFTQTEPNFSNIGLSDPTPIINETIAVTANVANATTVYLGFRSELGAPFTKILMLDDGLHQDGAANDGVFGANFLINNAFIQYYFYAENSNAGKFSPQRAEHEFYTLTATVSNPNGGDLVINEFMASNSSTVADQNGQYDDWIELYNNSTSSISLEGYFLSDDGSDTKKWAFPAGTSIPGHGYLVVWADNDESQAGLHANFKLSASAESVLLVNPAGDIIDEVSYVNQTVDISYGRFPNGTGNFQLMNPTFNAENTGSTNTTVNAANATTIHVNPNPADDAFYLKIESPDAEEKTVFIYNLNGTIVYQNSVSENERINTADWTPGMYFIRVENVFIKLIVK